MRVIVIMAGGIGERFWPMSRVSNPKQLLNLTSSGQSLLAEAIERSKKLVPVENIYIATSRPLKSVISTAIKNDALGIPEENILAEPSKRNTAGCLIYAAASILAKHRDLGPEKVTMGIMTADHRIPDVDPFVKASTAAFDAAENNDALVTLGMRPVRPETGYGYMEVDRSTNINGNDECPLYRVTSFHEKPTAEEAAKFIAGGKAYWNSGMFFWRICTFQNEFGRANPILAETLEDLTDAMMAKDNARAENIFNAMPNISIDYALMEKASNLMVIPGYFLWDDLGSWDALSRTFPTDGNSNVVYGDPITVDCSGSIIYNAPGQKKVAVAAMGLKDMVVVVNDDAVLIMPKSMAQDVRKVVITMRDRGASQV